MSEQKLFSPVKIAFLLNSTEYGSVTDTNRVAFHKSEAGVRVSPDGEKMYLPAYCFWLIERRHNKKPAIGYKERRKKNLERENAKAQENRNIYPIPTPSLSAERASCERDFKLFCKTFFKSVFSLNWSNDHIIVIEKIQKAVLSGGLFAQAMPRGSGKTSLCEAAAIWAICYAHKKFVVLICSDVGLALQLLESIKKEFENNEILAKAFPEICYPIQSLEGSTLKCRGQHCTPPQEAKPRLTKMTWTGKDLVFPTIDGSPASGSTIQVAGLTGQIRGLKHKLADGSAIRPDLVLVDDPQTDESAKSLSQCESRERILAGAVLGLAGPGKKIAGLAPMTVIRPGDLADRILDQETHPEWQGERMKMIYAFPKNEKLWEEYAEIRADALRESGNIVKATDFYTLHRAEMDEGAEIAWPERYNPDELSAVQHAMNLKLRDEVAFWSEYQNEPLQDVYGTEEIMSVDDICLKLSGIERLAIPLQCETVTAFIDVNGSLLYYVIVAWDINFSGFVIDYGAYPEQNRKWFAQSDARPTLKQIHGDSLESSIFAGLEALSEKIAGREYKRDDGTEMKISLCPIDANWGVSTETVYQFCRQSKFYPLFVPSHGKYVGAGSPPFSDYKKKPGEKTGLNWRMSRASHKIVRHIIYDTNFWKTFIHARLVTKMGNNGCVSLFGSVPGNHQMFAEHLAAEYRTKTEGRGRVVDEWHQRPGCDNHFLDCVVGASMAASVCGSNLDTVKPVEKPQTISLSRAQGEKRSVPVNPKMPNEVKKISLSELRAKKAMERPGMDRITRAQW